MYLLWLTFGHHGCGPCRMVSPIVDEIAEEVQGKGKSRQSKRR